MKERDIPSPHDIDLAPVKNKKHIRAIREACKLNGFIKDNEYVYWRSNRMIGNEYAIYVTVTKGIGKYLVLTCFYINPKRKK